MRNSLSASINNFRARGAAFLCLRDTVLMESALALTALLNARLVDTTVDGRSLAPFTQSALEILSLPSLLWVVLLTVMGVIKIAALGLGLWCEHRNVAHRYLRLRSAVSLISTCVWGMLVLAVCTARQPDVVALRYAIPCLFSLITYLALSLQYKRFSDDDERRSAQICRQCEHDVEHEIAKVQRDARRKFHCVSPQKPPKLVCH